MLCHGLESMLVFVCLLRCGGEGERGGPDDIVVLEVEEQAVGAWTRNCGVEGDFGTRGRDSVAGFAVGMDVHVREISCSQDYEVAESRQVRLQIRDRLAVLVHGERQ